MLNLQQIAQCMKNKFLYDNVNTKKADKIICGRYLDLNYFNNIKDKTALFAN